MGLMKLRTFMEYIRPGKRLAPELQDRLDREEERRREAVEAKQAWQNAVRIFESSGQEDPVDHLIYMINATQARYEYLLQKRKERDRDPQSPRKVRRSRELD